MAVRRRVARFPGGPAVDGKVYPDEGSENPDINLQSPEEREEEEDAGDKAGEEKRVDRFQAGIAISHVSPKRAD